MVVETVVVDEPLYIYLLFSNCNFLHMRVEVSCFGVVICGLSRVYQSFKLNII